MKIYAIHRQRNCHVTYNIVLLKSKKAAQNTIRELNKDYEEWDSLSRKIRDTYTPDDCVYMSFIYDNHEPYKYILEELNTLD